MAGRRLPLESDSDPLPAGPAPKPLDLPGRPLILLSACLLGERVRYDGQHKRDAFLVEDLGRFVEWVRVCPEADAGLGIPRPSMHLVGDPDRPRLVASRTGEDKTAQLERFTASKLRELQGLELCGYVCKKDSPSSGMTRVKVYAEGGGMPRRAGAGLFTRAFMERFPGIPVEEEGRLHDPGLREWFIERVFARRRWLDHVAGGRSRGRLVEFHSDHKYLLLAHGRRGYEALGRLVAHAKELPTAELYARYEALFGAALAERSTLKKKTDVLQHMLGYFKRSLTADEKQELLEVIGQYHDGRAPLVVPLTLLGHYVRKYDVAYLRRQAFLSPYPDELMLRNSI